MTLLAALLACTGVADADPVVRRPALVARQVVEHFEQHANGVDAGANEGLESREQHAPDETTK
jgi:hypothetical protein